MTAKLPQKPPPDLASLAPDWHAWTTETPMWHIGSASGPYANPFGVMRSYGPLQTARFDPHPLPAQDHPAERVLYVAGELVTALAERFQQSREIRCRQPSDPVAYGWFPRRPLDLIDLTGVGALRMGASQLLATGPKRVTRAWARAIRECWPTADGVLYRSSMAGRRCAALRGPAQDGFPDSAAFAKLMSDPAPAWIQALRGAAVRAGYTFAG